MSIWPMIFGLIRKQRYIYAFNAFLWSTLHFSWLIPGLIMREIFNTLSGEASVYGTLWGLIGLLVGVATARIFWLFISVWFYVAYRFKVQGGLQLSMLTQILRQPGAKALPSSPGEAISRFRGDVAEITDYTADRMVDGVGMIGQAVIGLWIMFLINAQITIAVAVPLVAVILIVDFARQRLEKYREASRAAAGAVTAFVGEIFGSIHAITVNDAAMPVKHHFDTINEVRRKAALKDTVFSELLSTIFNSTLDISTGIILLLSAQVMRDGTFTVGDFALFISFLMPVTSGIQFTGNALATARQLGVSIKRILNVTQADTVKTVTDGASISLADKPEPLPVYQRQGQDQLHLLEASNLSYHFSASSRGIKGVNLHLPRNSFTVVTGRIGSGKTTLLRVLLGLLAGEGTMHWNGEPIKEPANFFVPPRCAYTGQVPRLFSDSLRDNILMGLPEKAMDISTALNTAVMEQDLIQLEDGLDTIIGPRGVKLSGGQIQRTAAARMFVRQAELLVFDDLSSALDVDTERILWERVFANRTATYLVVSHRRSVLQRADHVIVLRDGLVESEGGLDFLLETSEEMQRLWAGEVETVV
ncbi:MAG: ABC transporter ATP-binding protein [Chloroflexota bacterium]